MNNSVTPGFEERFYLEANPDVAGAVKAGQFASGHEHFVAFGFKEDRFIAPGLRPAPPSVALLMTDPLGYHRRSRMLAGVDLSLSSGLEIGALDRPAVTRKEGNIFYVDRAKTSALKREYAKVTTISTANIVDVDAVWGEMTLGQCVGRRKFDYVVASHVVEHVPDLVSWLKEISAVLRGGGTLRLAAPDRRYTFDFLAHETDLAQVLDAYLRKSRMPTSRQVLEFCYWARIVDENEAWRGALKPESLQRKFTVEYALKLARTTLKTGVYQDAHCWFFTIHSFARLFLELAEVGLLNFKCDALIPPKTNEIEFYVHMSVAKSRAEIIDSWKKACKAIA
ncbi:MAG: class I SAM-dependent methyltransferase [Alphaproteobacteria bacterium]|nr:class I SAM-dependent methyltransferase [Alphaproteobacteria bacterium]